MSENLFRIGGVYRDKSGRVIKITGVADYCDVVKHTERAFYADATAAVVQADEGRGWYQTGWRRLEDGQYHGRDFSQADLLPGELHNVNGEWVPIEDPELVALQTRPQHVEASCEEEKPVKSLGALLREKLKQMEESGTIDRERAPLPYFTEQQERAKFDPWQDFIVHHREEVSVNAKPFAGLSLDGCEQFKAPRAL